MNHEYRELVGVQQKKCQVCDKWKNLKAFYRSTDMVCGFCSTNLDMQKTKFPPAPTKSAEDVVRQILKEFEEHAGSPIRRVLFVRSKK